MTTETTDASFASDVLASEIPVLVDFWAEWCPPCVALSPVLEAIADAHPTKLRVVKVNADDNPALAAQFRVTSLPTMKVFSGGEVIKTIMGPKPRPALEAILADLL